MKGKSRGREAESSRYMVPALERGLAILELLATEPKGKGIVEIASSLGLPKPSVFRMLVTLHEKGYLEKDDASVYRLSRKLLSLGYAAIDGQGLVEKSADVLRKLRDASGETALLAVLAGREGVVLDQAPSAKAVKVLVQIGHRFPLHTAAPGKALMAFLPEEERTALAGSLELKRYTEATITTRKALEEELARVRESGTAFDRGEELEDIRCVGAPVFDWSGRPVAAIWISGPASRFKDADLERLAGSVAAHAKTISERLSP